MKTAVLKSRNRFFHFTGLISLVGLSSCNYHVDKTSNATGVGKSSTQLPSFTELSSQILAPKCLTCHNGAIEVDLGKYSEFMSSLQDTRSRLVDSGASHMPRAGHPQLSPDELSTLLAWIDAGGPEAGGDVTPAVPVPAPLPIPAPAGLPGFEDLKVSVLNNKCMVCHDGTADPDAIDLRAYTDFKKHAASAKRRILSPLDDGSHMPEADHPQLTASELNQIVAWIDGGAPEQSTSFR